MSHCFAFVSGWMSGWLSGWMGEEIMDAQDVSIMYVCICVVLQVNIYVDVYLCEVLFTKLDL